MKLTAKQLDAMSEAEAADRGWELCLGDDPALPTFIRHFDCPHGRAGGWERWGETERAKRSIYYAGEAVLLEIAE